MKVVCRPLLNIIYQNHSLHFLYIYTHETEVLFSNVLESNVISRLIGWDNEKIGSKRKNKIK